MFIPDMGTWKAVWELLDRYADFTFAIEPCRPQDGLVFEGDGLRVVATHNRHLGEPAEGEPWESFSYRIEAGDGKSVVFSGDVADTSELQPLLGGADLVLMETGHHTVFAGRPAETEDRASLPPPLVCCREKDAIAKEDRR